MSEMRQGLISVMSLGLFLLVVLTGADSLAAQQIRDRPWPAVGSNVRVEYLGDARERTVRGVLASADATELTLTTSDEPRLVIPESAITGLEVALGRSKGAGALKGLAWGAATGATVIGLVSGIGYNDTSPGCQLWCPSSRGDAFKFGAIVGALIGGPIGLTIGAVRGSERWERIR